MQLICDHVIIDPMKEIRKFPKVQHLYAKLTGKLRSEEDEVNSKLEYGKYISSCIPFLF